jgi:hypothetical protein
MMFGATKSFLLLSALLSSSLAFGQLPDLRKTVRLESGMSQDRVEALFGPPARTSLTTCGTKTPEPWECLIWNYGSDLTGLKIYFQRSNGRWIVDSWNSW